MNYSTKYNPILKIRDLNLVFKVDHFKNRSVRDLFVDIFSSPIETLKAKRDYYHVLNNINFEINPGDKLGIVGINGAGKTTLCRCIAGMITPDSGTIEIAGETRAIFDTSVGIIPELTGRENAEIIASLIYPNLNKEETKDLINEALEFSELGEFIDVPFLKYSKGMQARLNLSLVSAKGCDLIILDEVYDGADISFQKKISKRVLDMINKSGAVIFVSHSVDQIKTVCNRLIILDDSKIIYNGDVDEGLTIYQNRLGL